MEIQWYAKDNCEMLNWVIVSVIAYRFVRKYGNKLLTFIAGLYVGWRLIDIPLYWINYKTEYYGWVYIAMGVIILVRLIVEVVAYLKQRQ